ncbi:SMC-Scp complex subunit ScpB, partial [Alphaproteobacteria bacterium]|nr:SMC-Scp complex subunit ScpB [Alphaproteobacteria bacterium]
MTENTKAIRMVEALLFASKEPIDEETLSSRIPREINIAEIISELVLKYEECGVNLCKVAGGWSFRTAPDLSYLLERERTVVRKLSKAGIETLAIIAYHQPVTRAEVEEIRGVSLSKGTLDVLLEAGWISIRGRKRAPGRPVMYGTSNEFLNHFGLQSVDDLPGIEELKATGLLDSVPPIKEEEINNSDSRENSNKKNEIDGLNEESESENQII